MGRYRVLLCRTGASVCAVPVAGVSEVMRRQPIRSLAGAPDYVDGVAILRGAPTPVIDLAKLLGVEIAGPPNYLVSLKLPGRRAALAVGELLGVIEIDESAATKAPPLLRNCRPEVISSIGALDNDLLVLLETGRLVPDQEWMAQAGGGAK